jgi:mannose-6-phosphate isomerase-like protein (cupin superfamily)
MKTGGIFWMAAAMCFAAASATAQGTPADGGITVWKNGVPPGGISQKADFGDHLLEIIHRDANGQAELHKTQADVIVIQTGHATVETGGEVVDGKETAPNEVRGSSIKGGVKHEVGPGDIINIPAGVPHRFFVEPGTAVTYFVVKVTKR